MRTMFMSLAGEVEKFNMKCEVKIDEFIRHCSTHLLHSFLFRHGLRPKVLVIG